MIVTIIPKDALPAIWPLAEPYIVMALEKSPGLYRPVDVLHNILNERETLWGIFDENKDMVAAFTTMINEFPLCRRLLVHHVGGSRMADWDDEAEEILINYAKDTHCTAIDGKGRDGWSLGARSRGWKKTGTVFTLDLQE